MRSNAKKIIAVQLLLVILIQAGCGSEAFVRYRPGEYLSNTDSTLAEMLEKETVQEAVIVNTTVKRSIEDIDYKVYDIYITIYPTYGDDGEMMTREVFEYHKSLDRAYNPVLNCHIWDGNPEDTENTEGKVGYNDALTNATIRVRGNSSRGDTIKSYKIKLDEKGAEIFGADSININKHMQDPLRVVNKACMDMMQFVETGYVSLDTYFVHLYINDVNIDGTETGFQDHGLYTYVEQPNRDFLKNHGLDVNGALYKPINFEFQLYEDEIRTEEDPLYNAELFDTVIRPMENPEHGKLREFLDAINNYSMDFREVADQYIDEDNYLTWMALNILLGRKDALVHNFLLYSPSNSDKWYFLPWDYDESLFYYEVENWGAMNYQSYGIHYYWIILLHQRYFRIEGNSEKLDRKMNELMNMVMTEELIVYMQEQSIAIIEEFFVDGVDSDMQLEYLYKKSRKGERYAAMEDPETVILEEMKEEINLWYQSIVNNYERYKLSMESPTAGHIQVPVMEDGKYVFRWDTSNDFQGENVTYDFQIASDHLFYEVLAEETGLRVPAAVCDSLPEGHLFYRYIVRDESGNVQYPLNILELRDEDGELIVWSYGMGYLNNGASGDYVP